MDKNRFFFYLQTTIVISMFMVQVIYIIRALRVSQKINAESMETQESSAKTRKNAHNLLRLRFGVMLFTQSITWIPLAFQEFVELIFDLDYTTNWAYRMGMHGKWLGLLVDSSILLCNHATVRWTKRRIKGCVGLKRRGISNRHSSTRVDFT